MTTRIDDDTGEMVGDIFDLVLPNGVKLRDATVADLKDAEAAEKRSALKHARITRALSKVRNGTASERETATARRAVAESA